MPSPSSIIDDHRKSSKKISATITTTTTTTTTSLSSSHSSSSASSGSTGIVINPHVLNLVPKSKENVHHHHHHHHHYHYASRLKRLPKAIDDYRTPNGNVTGDGAQKAALASVLSAAASMLMPNISSSGHFHHPHQQRDLHFHPQPSSSSSSPSSEYLLSKISSLIMMNQSSSSSSSLLLWSSNSSNQTGRTPMFGSSPGIEMDPIIPEQEPEEEIPMSFWIKIVFYVIYMLICWLGIFGNIIVCYVVARKSSMHTVTNVFIANLALSDILLCLFAVPFTPLYLITFKSWIFGRALCHLVPFAQGVSVYISAFTLMSIAIDRYFVILHPFKPRMQMRTCLLIIATIWISAMILTFPYAHFMKFTSVSNYDYDDLETYDPEVVTMDEDTITGHENSGNNSMVLINLCAEEWPHEEISKMFGITTTILQFVIPFLMITFCYVKICSKLSDRARTIPGNVSARREEQERERTRKTNGMLISMVVIFVVSWLPMNMLNLLADFYTEATQWPHHETLFLISHAIAMSSTCYNPFLYAWLNDNFRKEFKDVLPCFGWLNRYLGRIICGHEPTATTSSNVGSINQNRSSNIIQNNININNNNNNNNPHHPHHGDQRPNHQNHHDTSHDNNNNVSINKNGGDGDHVRPDDDSKFWNCEDGGNNNHNNHNKDNAQHQQQHHSKAEPGTTKSSPTVSNSSFKRKFMNFRRSSSTNHQRKKDANKSKISMSLFHHHHHHRHHHDDDDDNGHKHSATTDVEEARQSLITKDQIPARYDGTYVDRGHNDNYRESISIVLNSNTSSSSNSSNATGTTNLHSQLD